MIKVSSPVFRGFVSSVLMLMVLSLGTGLLMHFTSISESACPFITLAILTFSVFMGGFWAARRAGAKGLLIGLEVALAFIILTLVITLVLRPGELLWKAAWIKLLLMSLAGSLGGMVGVAFSEK